MRFKTGEDRANTNSNWSSWLKPGVPSSIATGPPAGLVLPSGRIVSEYYTMGGAGRVHAGALISDDGKRTRILAIP